MSPNRPMKYKLIGSLDFGSLTAMFSSETGGGAVTIRAFETVDFSGDKVRSRGEQINVVIDMMSLQDRLRRHKVLVSVALGGLGMVVIVVVVVGRAKKPVASAPAPLQVDVVQVQQQDVPLYSEWIGTTDGMVNADVRAQVSGYLLKKDYTEGAFVKQGQLLFEIDPRPLQAVLNQASGDLAKAEGQVQQAVTQLDQALAQLGQANSQLTQAEANQ